MKVFRKYKDEREKNEITRISSIAFWITFWGLLSSIVIKLFIFDLDLIYTATEFIILIVCTIYIVVASYYRGIWDSKTNPGMKTYLLTSLLITLLVSIPISLIYYIRYVGYGITIIDSLRFFAIGFITTLIPMIFAISIFGTLIKRRQRKLADKYADDDTSQEE